MRLGAAKHNRDDLQQRRLLIRRLQVWRRRKNVAGKPPPSDSDPFSDAGVWKKSRLFVNQFVASAGCRFQFHKSSQLFIHPHSEALFVIAMCGSNPDCSPVGINQMANEMCPDVIDNSCIRLLFLTRRCDSHYDAAGNVIPVNVRPPCLTDYSLS